MNGWSLIYDRFDSSREDLRESLCTLGNGYFATRGAAPESSADDVHYPGTYLAGGYNRLSTEIAGKVVENEDLVNFPNWLPLTFRRPGGPWFALRDVDLLEYRQELDIRRGILLRNFRFQDEQGRCTRISQRRIVHMSKPHLAALETVLVAENWSGPMEFRSALDGRVINDGVRRYRQLNSRHLEPLSGGEVDGETIYLKVRTNQSRLEVAQTARTRLFRNGRPEEVERRISEKRGYAEQRFLLEMRQGDEVRLEKVVSLYSSRDHAISECALAARTAVACAPSFEQLLDDHVLAWKHMWRRFDIDIDCDGHEADGVPMTLRLHIFHLLQTVSLHTVDLDVGVPPRGWHGEAYRGHIFWDELYIFPLLNLRIPEITRALLRYRHRRLNAARSAAREAGYQGAMYPWQSGSDGREESQELHLNPHSGRWNPDHTSLQRHVNAAIAYNTWQYYQVTRDAEFLSYSGAEMILEIARFWASLSTWNESIGRYEIHGVMGPDEYHDGYPGAERPGLSNNAYTNIMAVWVLCTALEMLDHLSDDRRKEICETLRLQQEELARWEDISRRMKVVFHDDGIISQFEGYNSLEELDWAAYRNKYGPVLRMDRILEAEGDTPNRYKISKQADVLMLFYLFSSEELHRLFHRLDYPFHADLIPKNIEYYLPRTSHGSTLSHVVNSWVLARSDRARSWELFTEALKSDIADVQGGTTPEGIHLGAMAGTVDLIQRGYTGIETVGGTLRFNPCLPKELKELSFRIHYRGQSLIVKMTPERMSVSCPRCGAKPIRICFRDQSFELREGEIKELSLPRVGDKETQTVPGTL